MYEFKRSKVLDEIKMGDEVIKVEFRPSEIAMEFKNMRDEISLVEVTLQQANKTDENYSELLEQYGQAIVKLIHLIFGEENTKKILAFYENRYIEMTNEILPYIVNTFMPLMREEMARIKAQRAAMYKGKKRGWH